MAVRPEDSLAKMVAALKETTGKSLEEWRVVIQTTGLQKHGEVVAYLKSEHGITHGYANQISLRRNEAESTVNADDPVDSVFAKRALARELYNQIIAKVAEFGSDVDVAPKKAYISIRRKKQFAILQPAADRLDIGFNLRGVQTTERLEDSGSFNSMVSHRVRVHSASEVDAELLGWLRCAYEAS